MNPVIALGFEKKSDPPALRAAPLTQNFVLKGGAL